MNLQWHLQSHRQRELWWHTVLYLHIFCLITQQFYYKLIFLIFKIIFWAHKHQIHKPSHGRCLLFFFFLLWNKVHWDRARRGLFFWPASVNVYISLSKCYFTICISCILKLLSINIFVCAKAKHEATKAYYIVIN